MSASVAPSPWRTHGLLILLAMMYADNFVGRQIVAVMIEPIKHEFGASDTSIFRRTDGGWCREHLAKTGALNAIFSTGPQDPYWAVGAIRGSGGATDPVLLKRSAL